MATCAELRVMLAEADLAYHRLNCGSMTELIRAGEKQISYTAANINALRSYRRELQGKVDCCDGVRRKGRMFGVIPVDSNSGC